MTYVTYYQIFLVLKIYKNVLLNLSTRFRQIEFWETILEESFCCFSCCIRFSYLSPSEAASDCLNTEPAELIKPRLNRVGCGMISASFCFVLSLVILRIHKYIEVSKE